MRRSIRRSALAIAACATFGFGHPVARAAPQVFVWFDYQVGADVAGCPSADEFRASVEHQLRYDPFSPTADRRVAVQIARRETGYDGRIRWTDAAGRWVGERRLTSKHADCDPIAASLAFSVAVQIQLLAALTPPAPTPAPPPPSTVAPDPAAVISPQPTAEGIPQVRTSPEPAASGARFQLSAGLGPSVALGMTPQPTGLGRMFASGRRAWFSLELALEAALPTSERQVGGGGFSLDRFATATAACGHARAFAACLTGTVGLLRARGFGVDAPASPFGPFGQAGARFAATHHIGSRYFLAARVDVLVMISRWTVTLNDAAVWTTPRVGGIVGLDLGARFF